MYQVFQYDHVTTDKCIHSTKEVKQAKNALHDLQVAGMSLFFPPKCALSSTFLALTYFRLILTCSCSWQPLYLDWSISVWCWGKTWIWGWWCSNCWARCARMWTCLYRNINIIHVHHPTTANTVVPTMTILRGSRQNFYWGYYSNHVHLKHWGKKFWICKFHCNKFYTLHTLIYSEWQK